MPIVVFAITANAQSERIVTYARTNQAVTLDLQWNKDNYTNKEILPKPVTKLQRFVHMCDYLASRKFLDVQFENNEIIGG